MKIYLVGGAVRDILMGREPSDRDYVVVGSTPEEMESAGFKQVGKDFPVFLHPDTGEEYALARTEMKDGVGYNGFSVDFSPEVTLEEDLSRRDLTINAIAFDMDTCEFVDPFNGQDDIKNKVLRKVSDAFGDDPVRVLRLARFLARFGEEWEVDYYTEALCHRLMHKESEHMTAERVWAETHKALDEYDSHLFFEFMCKFDTKWFSWLKQMRDVPQPKQHHPEGDVFIHTMLSLRQAEDLLPCTKFAVLLHDIGKYYCMKENGTLHGHEKEGVRYVEEVCDMF